jgi:hypothetical protein
MSNFFDIELIDVNENVENFQFTKVSKQDLEGIISSIEENKSYFKFKSLDGFVILDRQFFRGLIYVPHVERQKSVVEETLESAEEIGKINVKNKHKVKL